MIRYSFAAGGVAGLAVALSGCGTLYKLDVTAYSDPRAELGKTYVVLSGDPDLDVNSAEFAEYAKQVERALAPKGYQRVSGNDLSAVDLGIYLAADISESGKRYHKVSTPMYEGPTPDNLGAATTSYGGPPSGGGSGGGGGGQQGMTVEVPPQPREILSGYEQTSFATTVYTKHLNLIAVDLQQYLQDIARVGREDAVPREIWSIDIETTGKPSDLTEVIPVMLAAGQDFVGESTEDVVQVRMNGTDRRIGQIKGDDCPPADRPGTAGAIILDVKKSRPPRGGRLITLFG